MRRHPDSGHKPARKRHPGKRVMSSAEVTRAIFLDYECSKDTAPTLLGYRIDGETRAGIVEQAFHLCAGKFRASATFDAEHGALVLELIERAVAEDRLIVSWSTFDYDHMVQELGATHPLRTQLDDRYVNAIVTAERWRRSVHPDLREPNTLAGYVERLRIHVPERFGADIVGKGLRRMREQITAGRDYAELTRAARTDWQRIVRHNAFDLEAMQAVLEKATAKLEKAAARASKSSGE